MKCAGLSKRKDLLLIVFLVTCCRFFFHCLYMTVCVWRVQKKSAVSSSHGETERCWIACFDRTADRSDQFCCVRSTADQQYTVVVRIWPQNFNLTNYLSLFQFPPSVVVTECLLFLSVVVEVKCHHHLLGNYTQVGWNAHWWGYKITQTHSLKLNKMSVFYFHSLFLSPYYLRLGRGCRPSPPAVLSDWLSSDVIVNLASGGRGGAWAMP